jgi:ABC-type transport system involved in cytochrome bd biosynthesis fused ATPase/permease subunit
MTALHFSFSKSFPLAHLCATLVWRLAPEYVIVQIVCSVIASSSTLLIRNMEGPDSLKYVFAFAIFKTVYEAMEFYITSHMESNATKKVARQFLKDQFNRYDTTDYRSRQIKNALDFNSLVEPVKQSTDQVISWGLGSVVQIVSNMLSCAVIAYDHPWVGLSVVVYGVCVTVYAGMTQIDIVRRDKEIKDDLRRNVVATTIALGQFQNGIVNLHRMIEMKYNSVELQHQRWVKFTKYGTLMVGLARAPIWLLAFLDHRVAMLTIVMQLVKSIDDICKFMVQYQRMETDYTSLNEMWAGMAFRERPPQVQRPGDLDIVIANVRGRDGETILQINEPMHLTRPGFYLAMGPSGGGKTTFINALMGNYGGLVLDGDENHQPGNYHTHFAVLDQKIKSLLQLKDVTLRQVLDGASDAAIDDIAIVVELTDWIARHGRDTPIRDTMNEGGEKSRLALALILMRAAGKPYIVLDEFEQGIDAARAYRILARIRARFSTTMLIVITHLETVIPRFQDQLTGVISVNAGVAQLITVSEALMAVEV